MGGRWGAAACLADLVLGPLAGAHPLLVLVAVCASNSFVLPTHQVNALTVGPGGYKTIDFVRAGGGMTILFLAVAVVLVYAFYL